jgi:hypothetical protein
VKAAKLIAQYGRLRKEPLWRLLAADHGPAVIALLQTHLYGLNEGIPASIFQERITRDLDQLNADGQDLRQTAQAYIGDWLREGLLERRFPAGAAEEEYSLSSAAAGAIRFATTLADPRSAATESRLAVVIQQLVKLAEETDTNPESRMASLLAERDRLDREMENVRNGSMETLPDGRALERIREIIGLTEGLSADFRRVRDDFDSLNRNLRERILDETGNRGDVLENLFAGVDVIAESEAGRTFSAFWRLLTDPEQSASLDESLDQVLSRGFSAELRPADRRFLLGLTRTLLAQGGSVHEVLRHFATSLKSYVQSREFLEQRQVSKVLREAQRAARSLKDQVRATDTLEFQLQLTSARLASVSQWSLYDPSTEAAPGAMADAETPDIDLEMVRDLVAMSEIDFGALKANIRTFLCEAATASIAEILDRFPALQGLGSVVGYLALGSRHGVPAGGVEMVEWRGSDGEWRRGRISAIYFLKERIDELS